MEEKSRYAVGIDLGSNKIRVVIGSHSGEQFVIAGYGEASSEGIRRGAISDLQSPLNPLIEAIHAAENMSGYTVTGASLGINSGSIASTYVEGMVLAQEAQGRGLGEDDLIRVEEAAMKGKVPNNREILDFVPFEYIVDGQGNVRDPLGMTCSRLEIRANAISAMMPDVNNIRKICEEADNLSVHAIVPTAMAAAEAIVTNHQRENGVGVVNFGSNTTSIAIYDEGELQYVNVIPLGSNDVTRDLATILAATPDLAEEVKLRYADASFVEGKDVTVKRGRDEYVFGRSEINEVVEARLDEIFEAIEKCLKSAGYDKRLPEGLILTGGGSKMRNLDIYVRSKLGMAVRIGEILPCIESSAPEVLKPEYTTAIGLMLRDMEMGDLDMGRKGRRRAKKPLFGGGGLSGILKMFH